MSTPTPSKSTQLNPPLSPAKSHAKSRRIRYILASLALAVILIWLAGPLLSSNIVPPPATPSAENTDIALVIKDGQTWLALPRPDGSSVAFAFAPQSPPSSTWDAITAFVSSRPGALLKSELSDTLSTSASARQMQGQETLTLQAPQQKAFELTARLDALYAQNITSFATHSNTGIRQVSIPDRYAPLVLNANQWTALHLSQLGIRVEGTGLLTRWSIQPATP